MNTYDKIDLKQLEKAAYDAYNVRALMGCLTRSIHDKIGDSLETEEEKFYWQLKGAIQIAYDILDDTTTTFFEVLEIVDREIRQSSVVKGQAKRDAVGQPLT